MLPYPWLALNLSAIYLVLGVFSPFWGVWLESVGLQSEQIGLLLGIGFAMRLLGSLTILRQAKRAERLIPIARFLVFGGIISFVGFYLSSQFWVVLLFTLLANFIYPTLLPLTDAIAARMVIQVNLDYGNVRLWGSAAFIVGATLIGFVIEHLGKSWILHCIVLGLLLAGFCIHMPMRPAPRTIGQEKESHGYSVLLRNKAFLNLLLIEALIFGSHAAYNSFSAIYWNAQGFSASTISMLWTTGVIFEILMFAVSRRLLSDWSPERLLCWACIGAVIRWVTLGTSLNLWLLFPAQALHSFSFALAHLGAMRYLSQRLPREAMIPGQTLYSAVGQSLSLALFTVLSGIMYHHMHQFVFLAMAVIILPAFYLIWRGKQTMVSPSAY
ncbi:3-phenylpropionate MFS transporter [Tolumonas lignilytica]|jgi:Arabinose efflux permease|uniref:3-phenylpropionate MFS transporter n=1 Tax=Tolumonas lignilytica TaxID=1283284 RepID=UPI000465548F|nr:3-phenylpropionate MFS transporter [Tolumonas lignilytica]